VYNLKDAERLKAKMKAVSRYVYPVALDNEEAKALEGLAAKLGLSRAEAIREAIRHYADYVKGMEVVKMRNISMEEAKKEVLAYLEEHERAWSSTMADDLRLDIGLVNEILQELWSEEKVEPARGR
jgi:predicted DNA-binding protein